MQIPELIPGIEAHDELNPLLWHDDDLRPDVRQALLGIAERFRQYLEVDVDIKDIIVTGSQASYNYTDHSDLDLHLIVDYRDIKCDQPVDVLLDTKRKLWKHLHDIRIHGVPVELYAEDLNRPVKGMSYSLVKMTWLRKPQRAKTTSPEGVERLAKAWITLINQAIDQGRTAQLAQVKALLMQYRQQSLDQAGEMSRGNLVFKMLRNTGTIALLMQALNRAEDQDLSLPE